MKEIKVEIIQGRGSYYNLGMLQGLLHKGTKLEENHLKRRKRSIRSYEANQRQAKTYYDLFAPGLWSELEGLSEGLEWSLEDIVHEYSGYQQNWDKTGCSALMQNGVYVRNYDYHPKTYEGRFLLFQPDQGFASVGFGTRMIGRMDGMNEKGLVVGYHFVNRRRQTGGFICCTLARFILESCETTEEAIAVLERAPHRHAFNYSLYDRSGNAAVVEASGRGVRVLRGATMACTNHFHELVEENRHHLVESTERLENIRNQIDQALSIRDSYQVFNDPAYGVFKEDYKNSAGTLHTVAYEPHMLQVAVGIGRSAEPFTFSFKEWIEGKPLDKSYLKGIIHTTEEFPFEETKH
ncbi:MULTISPECIES: C45 family autoproteolytic acyltransferase/hydolase [Priestia]|uniref:Acyl-CoA--6-aminopenicillanic acid acyl-transferase n=1 Tax=Priestia veravalensis TaxID=1414648 RepID=A0A0V8JPW3_9BACI|nr:MULTISPECIES: C45 family peptidase [Priestia]KSU89079.1 acyl-CoA--6-aminopenicillanic acid acyl-transferase [Priestia veravalensis]MED4587318.1 C45 family autoproteolytic acyltransferase/hydrolase [Priestia flexa]SCB95458.1 Predicted choloylglycine hydrolase [Priestia flexa]